MTPRATEPANRFEAIGNALSEGYSFQIVDGPSLIDLEHALFHGLLGTLDILPLEFRVDQPEFAFKNDHLTVHVLGVDRRSMPLKVTCLLVYLNREPVRSSEILGGRIITCMYSPSKRNGDLYIAEARSERNWNNIVALLNNDLASPAGILARTDDDERLVSSQELLRLRIHHFHLAPGSQISALAKKLLSIIATWQGGDPQTFSGYIVTIDAQALAQPIRVTGEVTDPIHVRLWARE